MAEQITVQAVVVFETVVDVPLRMSQEKFDAQTVETQKILIETSINEITAKRNAEFVGVELITPDEIALPEVE